jgi:hypothetical protein
VSLVVLAASVAWGVLGATRHGKPAAPPAMAAGEVSP